MTLEAEQAHRDVTDEPKVFGNISESADIHVLVVDDDPNLLDLTATYLERERSEFEVTTSNSAHDVLESLDLTEFDGIVSDYDMPTMDGLEFLTEVRVDHEDLPFVLFTAKGSEEIASEAISKGLTDYLQKKPGASQYSILANRVVNAVEQYRAKQRLQRSQKKFSKLVMNSTDVLAVVDDTGTFDYISPACKETLGYEQEELIGESAFDYMPADDRKNAMEEFFGAIEKPDREPKIEFRFQHPEGGFTRLEARGKNLFDDDFIEGFVVNARDVTDLKERERELEQQNERLKDMRSAISHKLRDPLNVAVDSLSLYRETDDEEYLDKTGRSLVRIDSLIDQILKLSESDTKIEETEQVSLAETVRAAWEMIETDRGTLHVDDSRAFEADPDQVEQAFENLFRNAIDHNDGEVTIRVGTTDDGVYVQDDGTGIPENDRDRIFEPGYTTEPDHAGFGLNIVKQIVAGHGWDIEFEETTGGTRFEIVGVSFEPMVCE